MKSNIKISEKGKEFLNKNSKPTIIKVDSLLEVIKTQKDADDFMRQLDSLNPKNNRLSEAEGKQILKELIKNYSDDIDSATTSDGWGGKTFIMESIIDELIKRLTK